MKYLNLDILNVYIDEMNIINRTLIKRIPVSDENQIQYEIIKFLNDYEEYEQIKEDEKPNGYKWFYRVRQFNGLYTDFGFNLTYEE